jgi:putative aldouronate transport system substrate-binding protein
VEGIKDISKTSVFRGSQKFFKELYMKRITITLVLLLAAFLCFTCKARSGSSGTQSGAVVLGYPIVTDGSVTLRYWVPIQVSASRFIQSYAENPAYQEMEKRTGVKIEFNLLMASGDLPDLMTSGNLYRGGEFQGLYDGIFLDLTDLVPRYAPEYMKLIRDDEEFFREVSDDDGKLVAFFAYKPYGDPPFTRVILRKDILAEVGRDIPRLISDYDSLFAAMLAKDIVPFLPPNNGLIKQFVGAYGIIPGMHKNAAGRIQYGQVLPEFRQYLEMMNRWYAAGYISKDFTSVTTPQGNTLFDTKKIGMQIGAIVANFNRGATLGFEVTSAPYPRLRAGDQLHHEDTNI